MYNLEDIHEEEKVQSMFQLPEITVSDKKAPFLQNKKIGEKISVVALVTVVGQKVRTSGGETQVLCTLEVNQIGPRKDVKDMTSTELEAYI